MQARLRSSRQGAAAPFRQHIPILNGLLAGSLSRQNGNQVDLSAQNRRCVLWVGDLRAKANSRCGSSVWAVHKRVHARGKAIHMIQIADQLRSKCIMHALVKAGVSDGSVASIAVTCTQSSGSALPEGRDLLRLQAGPPGPQRRRPRREPTPAHWSTR